MKASKSKETATMECRRCGICCQKHQAFVTPEDIDRITVYLGITLNDWEKLYDDRSEEHTSELQSPYHR
jgi:hypothetical protein